MSAKNLIAGAPENDVFAKLVRFYDAIKVGNDGWVRKTLRKIRQGAVAFTAMMRLIYQRYAV